jgi:valine--pyruvate aminotransferase
MNVSAFGEKLTRKTGILELMEDLGKAMAGNEHLYMLGGGNPAHIPEVNTLWRGRMEEILADGDAFERMVVNYDTPQGKEVFLEATAELFKREYGWNITAENVAVTNSSQTAFMILFNIFAGTDKDGSLKKILFPLMPEYVGYADQVMTEGALRGIPARIEEFDDHTFKYRVDFDALNVTADTGAICVSRPTNPSGNVLTDGEIRKLAGLAEKHNIPLLIDNAYGTPFPNILFTEANPFWNEQVVVSMSLSKIGLPSTRTGIIIAKKEIISALSAANAVISLSCGTLGQMLTLPLIQSGKILSISRDIVQPYYREKSIAAQQWVHEAFAGQDYGVHRSEGAIFLWLWYKNLSITTKELYEILKKRKVLVIPGKYFFYGLDTPWEHRDQCIRINYAQPADDVRRGIEIIAEETARYAK